MLQANSELSPFDIRNILQEQATYRECHYMAANEPCVDDLVPKNRQNNVYGHGHVNALESVIEAAQYNQQYQLDSSIKLVVENDLNTEMRVKVGPGESVDVDLSQSVDTIQWRSSDLRHDWTNIHSYDYEDYVTLYFEDIVHELEHLPGTELMGNHTISMRGLDGTSSSSILSIKIMLSEDSDIDDDDPESANTTLVYGSVFAAVLLTIILLVGILKTDDEKEAIHPSDEIVEAQIID